jgi:hypothetical protein
VCSGQGRAVLSRDDPRMEGIKQGFVEHGGFDINKPLYCIIDPEKIGADAGWEQKFSEDPTQAEKKFSNPDTLLQLVGKFGAIVVDGAHRW